MGRRKQDAVARGENVAAGGASLASTDQLGSRGLAVGRVHRHGVDLIAWNALALMLKAQHAIVGGEVGLGVLPTEGELADVAQMFLLAGSEERRRRCARRSRLL